MIITICGRQFDSDKINNITIRENASRILIDTDDNFYNFVYRSEDEVLEAKQWIKLQTLTLRELNEAIVTIVMVCNHFINSNNQCAFCPIKRSYGCVFETIPLNWRC